MKASWFVVILGWVSGVVILEAASSLSYDRYVLVLGGLVGLLVSVCLASYSDWRRRESRSPRP